MTPAALRRLAGLAEARRARDLARLDGLLTEDRRLQAGIAALAAMPAQDHAGGIHLPPAQQALRFAWIEQRVRAATAQRAALTARIAAARAEAVRSLGKHRALENLLERGEKEVRQQALARAEREAPPPVGRAG